MVKSPFRLRGFERLFGVLIWNKHQINAKNNLSVPSIPSFKQALKIIDRKAAEKRKRMGGDTASVQPLANIVGGYARLSPTMRQKC